MNETISSLRRDHLDQKNELQTKVINLEAEMNSKNEKLKSLEVT